MIRPDTVGRVVDTVYVTHKAFTADPPQRGHACQTVIQTEAAAQETRDHQPQDVHGGRHLGVLGEWSKSH